MAKQPDLGELLRRGATGWNALRKDGAVATDYTGATLEQVFSAGADLSKLSLVGTEWDHCELGDVDFRDSDLSNAYFHHSTLTRCRFRGADLSNVMFERVKMDQCTFLGAKGLATVETDDVIFKDVEGLDEDGPTDEDQDEDAPDDDSDPFEDEILRVAGLESTEVQEGPPATDDAIRAAEESLGHDLPDDYQAFQRHHGALRVEHPNGFVVFPCDTLAANRAALRASIEGLFADSPEWKTVAPEKPDAALVAARRELRKELDLTPVQADLAVGNRYDPIRIAHQMLTPIMGYLDDDDAVRVCVGPNGQICRVTVRDADVKLTDGSFSDLLREAFARITDED